MTTTPSTTPSSYPSFDDTGASDTVSDTDPTASDKAKEAASTATDEGKKVASTATEEAKSVATEATGKARDLLDEAVGQVTEHSRSQLGNLSGVLRSLGDDLQQMVSDHEGSGVASDVVKQAADRAHAIGGHLDGREPADLLDDLRRFARQRPAVFLGGALVAGVLVGRFARGMKGNDDSSKDEPFSSTPQAATVTPSTYGDDLVGSFEPTATSIVSDPSGQPTGTAEVWSTGDRQAP